MKLKVVYYMPNEEVLKKGDLSRELCLVLHGACRLMEDEKVKRIVRDDVPNMAPVIGELAFFLGIVQPMSVRTRPDGDVQLLVLSKEDSYPLFDSYPEQMDIICDNILCNFGLDHDGEEITQVSNDDDEADHAVLKTSIKQSILRQQFENFQSYCFAAKAGDVERIRDLVRRGTDINHADYDGRTAFAVACREGSYKVVELLIEEGVDKDTKNRWGNTPLDEAISTRQGPVIELLTMYKASTNCEDEALECYKAANRGDIEQLRRLFENRVDPNIRQYDKRTAIHQAAAHGNIQLVEFLVGKNADVNVLDRWGRTPLQDAVSGHHRNLSTLLRSLGATMPLSFGTSHLLSAASRGDVETISLLIKNAGLDKNVHDFDHRGALHRSALNARLLAVSYLLGIAADPNAKDRWGYTPLDLALQGGTLYHMYCGQLIHSLGGSLGMLAGTDKGKRLLEELKCHSMHEIRALIDSLIEKRYDVKKPIALSDQDILKNREVCSQLVIHVNQVQVKLNDAFASVHENLGTLLDVIEYMHASFIPALGRIPFKANRSGADLLSDFDLLVRNLKGIYASLKEDREHSLMDDAENQNFAIDSDEEERLFRELDLLMESQERAEAFTGNAHKFMANSVQKTFRIIHDLQNSFQLICKAFVKNRVFSENIFGEPKITEVEDLQDAFKHFRLPEMNNFDLQGMIEDGFTFWRSVIPAKQVEDMNDDESNLENSRLPISYLIAGSEAFRQTLLNLPIDRIYCAILDTSLAGLMSPSQLRSIARAAREIKEDSIGSVVYSSKTCKQNWFVLLSGKLILKQENKLETTKENDERFHILKGEIFGGYDFFEEDADPFHFRMEVLEPCCLVEFSGEVLEKILDYDPDTAADIYDVLESVWKPSPEDEEAEAPSTDAGNQSPGGRHLTRDHLGSYDLTRIQGVPNSGVFRRLSTEQSRRLSLKVNRRLSTEGSIASRPHMAIAATPVRRHSISEEHIFAEIELYEIKHKFGIIENLWRELSMGTDCILSSVLASVHHYLGEVGSELFSTLFMNSNVPKQISKSQFWALWFKYLADEAFGFYSEPFLDSESNDACSDVGVVELSVIDPSKADQNVGWYEQLHARYSSSRRMRHLFFEEHMQARYESAFELLAGSLKTPIPVGRIAEFLQLLFPMYPYRVSSYNVQEFLDSFGRNGARSKELTWSDIRKALREQKSLVVSVSNTMIGSALNPESWVAVCWGSAVHFVAVYHFIAVPIRISFLPWDSMLDVRALATDLIADILTACNIVVRGNTAYKSSRSTWVTSRRKLFRKIDIGYIIAAIPLDWMAFLLQAPNELCCWLRLNKLVLAYTMVVKSFRAADHKEASNVTKISRLASVVFSIIHMFGCVWFYIGSRYQNWFPSAAISWYHVSDDLKERSFTKHHHKFGLQEGDTVFHKYLISFFWVATTLTVDGDVGDWIPSNLLEIIFCIILMILNLTLLRYVTGEVSSIVMKADETIIEQRAQLEAVETLLLDKRIGKDLRDEIRGHFMVSQDSNTADHSSLFSHMSHSLKMEVAAYTSREYLDNANLFSGCGDKLLDAASVLLQEVQFAPEEYLYRSGETANEMFFVVSGSLDEVSEKSKGGAEKVERTVHIRGGTGELSFFFGLRHLVGARANKRTGAVCLRLPRSQFLMLLKFFPEDEEKIAQAALHTFDAQPARSQGAGSVKRVGRAKPAAKTDSDEEKGEENGSNIDSGDVDSGLDSGEIMGKMGGDELHQRINDLKERRRNDRINLILNAAANGNLAGLSEALKNEGVNVCDALKRTPLHVASSEGQLEIVQYLVELGADINVQDSFRHTSLNDAVRHRHDEVSKYLCGRGATLVLDEFEAGVRMCQAAFADDADAVRRLIDNRVHVNSADDNGRTAMVNSLLEINSYLLVKDKQ